MDANHAVQLGNKTGKARRRRARASVIAVPAPDLSGREVPPDTASSCDHELQALRVAMRGLERELTVTKARTGQAETELHRLRQEIDERIRQGNDELTRANQALLREIEGHRQDQERIQEQNEFLNHVLESLTHPFYVLDANDYTVKMANSAAIHGGLAPGITCHALTHHRATPCDSNEHGCPLQLIKESKRPVTVEHLHFDRQGNPRHVEVHGYPIFDREGNVVQMLEYSLDITERKAMEQELRENAERIKHFAYTVSHDLKSPLVGILGLARLLHRRYGNTLDATGEKVCAQILKGIEQLSSLVEGINSFVKAKESPFHFELLPLLDLLETVREEFAPRLGSRGVSWSAPTSMPLMALDRLSMLRVFRNLVDNALKYGGKTLSRLAIGYQEGEEFHLISFTDDGVGIKEENFERIFELFGRNEEASGIEGSGLGLAIVREIVDKHRGRVWVESPANGGTTFYIALPKGEGSA